MISFLKCVEPHCLFFMLLSMMMSDGDVDEPQKFHYGMGLHDRVVRINGHV